MTDISLRPATVLDLPVINAIYNHYVECSTCTYQEWPSAEAERLAWFEAHGDQYPVIVAVEGEEIIGWGA